MYSSEKTFFLLYKDKGPSAYVVRDGQTNDRYRVPRASFRPDQALILEDQNGRPVLELVIRTGFFSMDCQVFRNGHLIATIDSAEIRSAGNAENDSDDLIAEIVGDYRETAYAFETAGRQVAYVRRREVEGLGEVFQLKIKEGVDESLFIAAALLYGIWGRNSRRNHSP